jgi:hypothetical protein
VSSSRVSLCQASWRQVFPTTVLIVARFAAVQSYISQAVHQPKAARVRLHVRLCSRVYLRFSLRFYLNFYPFVGTIYICVFDCDFSCVFIAISFSFFIAISLAFFIAIFLAFLTPVRYKKLRYLFFSLIQIYGYLMWLRCS